MDHCSKSHQNLGNSESEIFLLTKPPYNDRTRLCFKMIERSGNAILYLVGDGVYNLMSKSLEILPKDKIFACKEDMDARGIRAGEKATILAEFYKHLVEDIMGSNDRFYTF
jgi:tRNA 2-thiouridine synthesizing protein B